MPLSASEQRGSLNHGVQTWPCGDYSIGNRSSLIHEVERMPIGKKQVKSLMGIERNDIRLSAAHALERTRCTTMQSGVGSSKSRVLECDRQCVEPLFLRDSVREGRFQAQSRFIHKQQHRQADRFQAINLPTDDL